MNSASFTLTNRFTAVVLLVLGMAVVVAQAGLDPGRVNSASLPVRYSFDAIALVNGGIRLTGLDVPDTNTNPPSNARCVEARVNPSTLHVSAVSPESCAAARTWVDQDLAGRVRRVHRPCRRTDCPPRPQDRQGQRRPRSHDVVGRLGQPPGLDGR